MQGTELSAEWGWSQVGLQMGRTGKGAGKSHSRQGEAWDWGSSKEEHHSHSFSSTFHSSPYTEASVRGLED